MNKLSVYWIAKGGGGGEKIYLGNTTLTSKTNVEIVNNTDIWPY